MQSKCDESDKLVKELTNKTQELEEKLEKLVLAHKEELRCQTERLENESTAKLQVNVTQIGNV